MLVIDYLKTLSSDEVAVFMVKLMGNYMYSMGGLSPMSFDEETDLIGKVSQILSSSAVVSGVDITTLN